jgi:hypothetical protein
VDIAVASLAAALVFACAYLVGGRLSASEEIERSWTRKRWTLRGCRHLGRVHLRRRVARARIPAAGLGQAAEGAELLFAEQRSYLLALLSFVVVYGLEHMVLVTREGRRDSVAAGKVDAVYWVQLVG